MFVRGFLLGHRAFPRRVVAAFRAVVVSDEDPELIGQRQDRHQRVVEHGRRSAGEVCARGAAVGLHERIMGEDSIADHISDRSQRVAWREHHAQVKIADAERVAVGKKPVEIGLRVECARRVVEVAPEPRDFPNLLAYGVRRAGLLLEIRRGHQVVGMRVRVEDPFERQTLALNPVERPVGRLGRGAGAGRVEVENHVDQCAFFRCRVDADILATS